MTDRLGPDIDAVYARYLLLKTIAADAPTLNPAVPPAVLAALGAKRDELLRQVLLALRDYYA